MIVPRAELVRQVTPWERQMLELRCDVCQRELQEPGALVFSPPTTEAWIVEKYHVCTICWPKIRGLLKDEEEDIDVSH
jgi:hypothetical protein